MTVTGWLQMQLENKKGQIIYSRHEPGNFETTFIQRLITSYLSLLLTKKKQERRRNRIADLGQLQESISRMCLLSTQTGS